MKGWLLAAATYNLLWGGAVVIAPAALFTWAGIELPRYPEIWQCVGMMVGVYGVGYAIAAFDPLRHWPIVLVGLLGKVLGPIGFAFAWAKGLFPARFAITILSNDLVWWVPFAGILWAAISAAHKPADESVLTPEEALGGAIDQQGKSLLERSGSTPVLAVLLRHLGCTFCRQALADVAANRERIEKAGVMPVLVHLATEDQARTLFERYGVADLPRVSDPQARLYRSLGLVRGSFGQLVGPRAWIRGFRAVVIDRHGVGGPAGDGFQMPGAFLIRDGRVVRSFVHRVSSDRPDYTRLVENASTSTQGSLGAQDVTGSARESFPS
jgi:hypothetical protein